MTYRYWALGYRGAGTTVRVIIDGGNANVRVLDVPNAGLFLSGRQSTHIAVGMSAGMAWETGLPRSADWLVIMDGDESTKAIVQIVTGPDRQTSVDEGTGGDSDVGAAQDDSSPTASSGPQSPDPRELLAESLHPSARPGHPVYWPDGSREEMSPTGLVTFTGPRGQELQSPQLVKLYPRREVDMAGITEPLWPSGERTPVAGAPGVEQQRVVDRFGVLVGVMTYGADGWPGRSIAGGLQVRDRDGHLHLFSASGTEMDQARPINSMGPASAQDWGNLAAGLFNFLVPVDDAYKGVSEWQDISTGEKINTVIEIAGMIPGMGTVIGKVAGGGMRILRAVRWGKSTGTAVESAAGASRYEADYPKYLERKEREGKPARDLEDYVGRRDQLRRNRAAGSAWEQAIGNAKGLTANKGWVTGNDALAPTGRVRGQKGARIWDFMNLDAKEAIEAKSGQVDARTFDRQLSIDVDMVNKDEWQVTWILKEKLTPAQMQRLEQLASETNGKFSFQIGLG